MIEHQDGMQRSAAGFTLIEMLLVVVIIGILASAGAVHLGKNQEKARVSQTRASIQNLKTSILLFELELGRDPADVAELLKEGGPDWPGPFLDMATAPTDGWGTPLRFERRGKRMIVFAAGPDAAFSTEDDLRSP